MVTLERVSVEGEGFLLVNAPIHHRLRRSNASILRSSSSIPSDHLHSGRHHRRAMAATMTTRIGSNRFFTWLIVLWVMKPSGKGPDFQLSENRVQDGYGVGGFDDGLLESLDAGQLLNRCFQLASRVGEAVVVGDGSELFWHMISG
jgi:hypothetical protein